MTSNSLLLENRVPNVFTYWLLFIYCCSHLVLRCDLIWVFSRWHFWLEDRHPKLVPCGWLTIVVRGVQQRPLFLPALISSNPLCQSRTQRRSLKTILQNNNNKKTVTFYCVRFFLVVIFIVVFVRYGFGKSS